MGVNDSKPLPREQEEQDDEAEQSNPIFCSAIPDFDPIPTPSKHTGRSKSRSVSPAVDDGGTIPYYVPSSRGPSEVGDLSPGHRSSFLRNNSLDEVITFIYCTCIF